MPRRPRGRRIARREPPKRFAGAWVWLAVLGVSAGWVGCLLLAVGPLAADHGTHLWGTAAARVGAAGATWLAVILLTWRIGGPMLLVMCFSAACAAALLIDPRGWVLSAGAVVAATSYGLLGMVMTRPASGLRAIRELVLAALVGAAGGVAVTGYDVSLRPYRFRVMVLALTLVAALALARRLGLGFESLERRELVALIGAVVALVAAFGLVQAIRHGGPAGWANSVDDARDRIRDWVGAAPRTVEALVGFPALLWGVAVRTRRRPGWWLSAFGALAAAGIATSLVSPSVSVADAAEATGYDLLIGSLLGLALVGLNATLTRSGRRGSVPRAVETARPEPSRLGRLL
jgi:hypothetical protein